jgi:hypothetical protein
VTLRQRRAIVASGLFVLKHTLLRRSQEGAAEHCAAFRPVTNRDDGRLGRFQLSPPKEIGYESYDEAIACPHSLRRFRANRCVLDENMDDGVASRVECRAVFAGVKSCAAAVL